jgi:hypothetical protein
VDPKSAAGTAAAFSKPNKDALVMANSSLLFEYASQELLQFLDHRYGIILLLSAKISLNPVIRFFFLRVQD